MNKKKDIKQSEAFKLVVLLVCAAILLIFQTSAAPEGLEATGWSMLGIMIVTVILFISEALPMVCTCFLLIALMAIFKIDSLSNLMKNACTSTLFFCMTSFGIGGALKNTNIGAIIFRFLWKFTKGKSERLIAVIIILAAVLSVFIADNAAQVVAIAVTTAIIADIGDPEPGTSRLAGGMMLGIYVGALCGGLSLPCGNPVNVALMELSEAVAGKQVTFVQWAMFGIPTAVVFTAISCLVVPKLFHPEPLNEKQIAEIERRFESIPKTLQAKDAYFMIIMGCMVILWVASNWVSGIDITIVAIIGMILMMIPFKKVQLLDAKGYKQNFSVMVPVVMLCLFPLAKAMQACGLGEWIVNMAFSGVGSDSSVMVIYIVASICGFVLHLLIPSATASGALAVSLLAPIMVAAGIPATAAVFCIGIQVSVYFLFPIEGSWQHTFSRGYFSFDEVLRTTWPLTIASLVLSAFFTPVLALVWGAMI